MATTSIVDETIRSKREYAREYFKAKYPRRKDRETNHDVISEVLYQIRICDELMRPVTKEIIKSWIDNCTTELQVERLARNHKFAKKVA